MNTIPGSLQSRQSLNYCFCFTRVGKVVNVATIAVLNFFKNTLEGLSVELVVYFEDGTNDDVNN